LLRGSRHAASLGSSGASVARRSRRGPLAATSYSPVDDRAAAACSSGAMTAETVAAYEVAFVAACRARRWPWPPSWASTLYPSSSCRL